MQERMKTWDDYDIYAYSKYIDLLILVIGLTPHRSSSGSSMPLPSKIEAMQQVISLAL